MRKRQLKKIIRQADYSEIGFAGQGRPTFMDEKGIKRHGRLHPKHLGRLKKLIEAEKARRKACFRQAVIDVTGEDPETDWQ